MAKCETRWFDILPYQLLCTGFDQHIGETGCPNLLLFSTNIVYKKTIKQHGCRQNLVLWYMRIGHIILAIQFNKSRDLHSQTYAPVDPSAITAKHIAVWVVVLPTAVIHIQKESGVTVTGLLLV